MIVANDKHREQAIKYIQGWKLEKPMELIGRPYRSKRSTEANKKMWALLEDISKQVEWHGEKLSEEDWKDIFSASLAGQRSVPGLDGKLVFFGQRTSRFKVDQMSDMIELIYSFGSEREVTWSEETNTFKS